MEEVHLLKISISFLLWQLTGYLDHALFWGNVLADDNQSRKFAFQSGLFDDGLCDFA